MRNNNQKIVKKLNLIKETISVLDMENLTILRGGQGSTETNWEGCTKLFCF